MKKLVLMLGILVSVVSVNMGAMSKEEWIRAAEDCMAKGNKSVCQALINNGLPSAEQCVDKSVCNVLGNIYRKRGDYHKAIPYFEKAIALGDNDVYAVLGNIYFELQDWYNASKYYEISCNNSKGKDKKMQAIACYNLGLMYAKGISVRADDTTALNYIDKACILGEQLACEMQERAHEIFMERIQRILDTPEGRKAMREAEIEEKRQELELKKLELERQKLEQQSKELEQKLQRHK